MQVLKSKNSVINKAFFVEMVTFTKIIRPCELSNVKKILKLSWSETKKWV